MRASTHIAFAVIAGIALGGASAFAIAQTTQGVAPATGTGAPQNPAPGSVAPAPVAAPAPAPTASPAAPGQEPAGTAAPAQPSAEGSGAPAAGSPPAPSPSAPPAATAAPSASSSEAVGQQNLPPPDTTAHHPKESEFSFEGPFGTFDRAALQRGFQVYKEVCSVCHGLNLVAFHNLSDDGGPGFSEPQVKAIAAGFQVPRSAEDDEQGRTHDDSGQRIMRPGIPADYFPWKFENEKAARAANNGSLPPDLSVMAKAREGGPHYVYSLLTGYGARPPANEVMGENMSYNPFFPGHQIAMPAPLTEGVVTYADGTKATVDQMAHDVSTFLMWTAEPKMEERKRIGFGVIAFLLVFSTLLYLAYRKVWHGAH